MKQKTVLLHVCLLIVFQACVEKTEQEQQADNQAIVVNSISVHDFDQVITTESIQLGIPSEIIMLPDKGFAVYDESYNKVFIFDNTGNKTAEFGSTGKGPGEWDAVNKAADLNYSNGTFLLNNRGKYKFDIYDSSGEYMKSISYPGYLNYSHKTLLTGNKLLVSTSGKEESLAAILDLDNEGDIIKKIGAPDVPYRLNLNLEQQRISYSKGKIPDEAKNEALAAKTKNGYVLLMNTLGELRFYTNAGKLVNKQPLPDKIKKPIFDCCRAK